MKNLILVVSFALYQVTSSGSTPHPDCISPSLIEQCKQAKCSSITNFADCSRVTSPYPGGNQCCNDRTVAVLNKGKRVKRQAYNFANNLAAKWSLPIPYYYNFSNATYETAIKSAINHIESKTCIKFVASTTVPTDSYISFQQYSDGCVSFVGKSEKIASPIFGDNTCLGRPGQMIYLITQTLGLWHESQRPDAGQYVNVNRSNMDQSHWADFSPIDQSFLTTYGVPYDYGSIMHYAAKIYSNNALPTVVPTDPLYIITIGQKVELSFVDAKLLNSMYCSAQCPTDPGCKNGGYANPKDCSTCICPLGFQLPYCDVIRTPAKTILSPNDCGGELSATSNEQTITSPGYAAGSYPFSETCLWKISIPANNTLNLKFVDDFGIYSDELDVCQHWVELRFNKSANQTGPRFCGQDRPNLSLNSTLSEVLVIFQSNDVGVSYPPQKGFKLSFKTVASNQTNPCSSVMCMNNGTCIETSMGVKCLCKSYFAGDKCQVDLRNVTNQCDYMPCRNNGTCTQVNATSFKCQCQDGFYGKRCEHADCGGCDLWPGNRCGLDAKCPIGFEPPQNCTETRLYRRCRTRSWWICEEEYRNVTVECIKDNVCCDNAAVVNSRCAALGWTDWSDCSKNCGEGYMMRYKYGIRDGVYKLVDSEKMTCNYGACRCNRWFRWWC